MYFGSAGVIAQVANDGAIFASAGVSKRRTRMCTGPSAECVAKHAPSLGAGVERTIYSEAVRRL
jgi:hypothetical protein